MKKLNSCLATYCFVAALGSHGALAADAAPAPSVPPYNIELIVNSLPSGQRWIDHMENELLPFWTMASAKGATPGAFPTYRGNDGAVVDPKNPPPEYKAAMEGGLCGLVDLSRQDYIRMQARQTFGYGIAFHMTGKEEYLNRMKAGVDHFRKHGIDKKGGAYSYRENGAWGPASAERTSQDMAYALSGIGFYYYLTKDPKVLPDILAIKNYIFQTYFDKDLGLLKWVNQDSTSKTCGDTNKTTQRELVAQLDQVYAYMTWLTPSLPEPHRSAWKKDLHKVATIMMEQFFSEKYGFFWGRITNANTKRIGQPHTDFGHSIKTLWLIYQIGKYTNDMALVDFGKQNAARLIEVAYDPQSGSWAKRFDEKGQLDYDKEWWSLDELDQTTATLSLIDPSYARYLVNTYEYWFKYMIDPVHKEAWHYVDGKTNQPVLKYPKQHSWKNFLHTSEHALVGYMTTQQLKDQPITLYYAFTDRKVTGYIHPYFYAGKVRKVSQSGNVYKAEITDLH
jgi:mannose/cellobiose epimerase-like protein (N-acyl-D-glucosamine 2-epimerase family)